VFQPRRQGRTKRYGIEEGSGLGSTHSSIVFMCAFALGSYCERLSLSRSLSSTFKFCGDGGGYEGLATHAGGMSHTCMNARARAHTHTHTHKPHTGRDAAPRHAAMIPFPFHSPSPSPPLPDHKHQIVAYARCSSAAHTQQYSPERGRHCRLKGTEMQSSAGQGADPAMVSPGGRSGRCRVRS
jgi:hypothetical protein